MKKARTIAALTSAAMLALTLTACSSGSSGGKKTLTIEDYYTSQPSKSGYTRVYKQCAKKFGVKVNVSHVAGAGLVSKVLQQASSKTLPDVLMLDNPDVQQIAKTGALSPLKNYGLDGGGDVPGVVKAGTYQGKLYAVAPVVNSIALYYNVNKLKAAGVTPPKSWSELKTAAAKLTDSGKGQYGLAMSNINSYEGTWQFLPFFWTSGGDEKNLNTASAAKAVQLVVDLQKDGSLSKSSINWTQDDVASQFIAGKAAMMINGPWQLSTLKSTKNLKFASVPIPTPHPGQKIVSPLGGETFTIPNTGDNDKMKAAGKMVGCLNSASTQTKLAKVSGNIPSKEHTAADWAKSRPQIASFVKTVKTARARTGELGPKWPAAATGIYTAVQLALTGKAAPQAALKQAQAQEK